MDQTADPASASWNAPDTEAVFGWVAEFDWASGIEVLTEWQARVFELADRYHLHRVEEVDWIGYRRERDGFIGDFLRAHPDRVPPVFDHYPAGFLIGSDRDYRSTARLSYVTSRGTTTDAVVDHTADLVAMLGTPDRPVLLRPPVRIGAAPGVAWRARWVELSITVNSDIWFPWTWRTYQDGPEDEPMDNRVLSRLNGERLNALLHGARNATRDLGGRWWASDESGGYGPPVDADADGVHPDAPAPTIR